MKISNMKIRNFKSIKQMDLDFKDLNILIGANGAGKSNFISFFNFLNHILEDNLDYYVKKQGSADDLLYFGRNKSSELFFRIDFDDEQYYSCNIEPVEGKDSLFINESFLSAHRDTIDYTKGGLKGLKLPDSMGDRQILEYMQKAFTAAKVYHFHDTSPSAKVKQNCDINDNRFLRPDAGNLSAFLYFLQQKHPEHFNRIQDTIRLVAPFFSSFCLSPLKLNEEKISLEWKHREADKYFNAYHLSDGTLRMMCLITLLLQPELPEIILIDEPELGLHPFAITILAELLESASIKSQVIVSTQSVTLIDHFEPDDIVVVDFEDNQSKFKRLESKELEVWLEDYSLGEIWEKNVIGGRP